MWEYTDKVKDHFLNPKNAGEMKDASAVGEVGSLACGDALRLFLKVNDDGVIEDASFQTFGCASAIASSSVLTELVKGKTIEEAKKLTNKDIADYLGGLPKEKMHCSVMGQEALEAAIKNYYGEKVVAPVFEGKLVCKCFGVTDVQIRRAIKANDLKTVEDVTNFTKAGGGCGECVLDIEKILMDVRGETTSTPAEEKPHKKLTNIQRMTKVTKVIDEEIRPSLQKDGGDIELIDIDGADVYVALRGSCVGCPSSQLTLKELVERRLREAVDPDIRIKESV
ncbi:Fe-S cluster assembly protein NifU [Desulfovibrio inopinatus]|uniref:Fe-S cluster assembly protein NifU n=1 Tax=Desulfovibrio inopinatus TaxID=102109 RepID=UPI000415A136|nr:Fe-S cluster assembly protein NifU [Desulfovibrio inopinatus]